MMSRVSQEPVHLERPVFLRPIHKLIVTSTPSLKAPAQEARRPLLYRLKC